MTMDPKPARRIAILGTAPTWKNTPWDDPTLEIWGLNDMWLLQPPRIDRWFDLHPLDKMHFRPANGAKVKSFDLPAGYFLRPQGHLEWLRQQVIPVYVQDAAALGSRSARTFPKAAVEAKFGRHFASSPAWMIGLALLEGVTELHVYGIHLATEWEYLKQKPNMTFLLGLAAGLGVKVVLPPGCPLLAESHQYGYEADPDIPKQRAQRRMESLQHQRQATAQAGTRKWYQRRDPNVASRLAWLDAQIVDAKLGVQYAAAGRVPVGV